MKNPKLITENKTIQKKSFKDKIRSFFCKPFRSQKSKNTNLKIGLFSLLFVGLLGSFMGHWIMGLLFLISVIVTVIVLLSPVEEKKEVSKNVQKK